VTDFKVNKIMYMKGAEVQFAGAYVQVRTNKPGIYHQAKLVGM
jgi:hypothetical protein